MTRVEATCLCGQGRCVLELARPIPTESTMCHAASCRHNLGALCHSVLPLLARPDSIERLQLYNVSHELKRYFCGTCGSHMFEHQNDRWQVQSGVIDRIHSEQVFEALDRVTDHEHVRDTLDGGLSGCFAGADAPLAEQALHRESRNDKSSTVPRAVPPIEDKQQSSSQELEASCICGGVKFRLKRPDEASTQCSSPWPDLIVPYHSSSPANPNDVKWWICSDKWLAGTCACRSCRLGLGSPIQAWAFVSLSNIVGADHEPFTYDIGMLKSFESSKGALREFCCVCGATVFWHNGERPGVVDVSVGLLRAHEGSMARTWLQWHTDRVSFAEQAFDHQLIARLQAGLGT